MDSDPEKYCGSGAGPYMHIISGSRSLPFCLQKEPVPFSNFVSKVVVIAIFKVIKAPG
jgi:hypothetical protein